MKIKQNLPYRILLNPVYVAFGSLLLVLIPFLIWASLVEIDQMSHAKGNVIAVAKTQEIQASVDGVIQQILVSEGQKVAKNQVLITLDDSQYKASYEASHAKVAALKATLARLKAEVYNTPLIFDEMTMKYPEFTTAQTQLFERRKSALDDEIKALKDSLRLSQSELDLVKPLIKTGDMGKAEVIKLKKQISEKEGEIINRRNKFFQDAQTEMARVEEELSTREQEMEEKKVSYERTKITSPVAAFVKNIILTTGGAKVRPGDVIMQLVPYGDELIVETKLLPADLSFVKVGQKAAIKLDAYDYSIYGIFHGKVKYISPDALTEKTAQGEKEYFRVQISINQNEMITKSGKKIELTPGMTAQVDIVTGSRTILTYLTKPIVKTLSESFSER